MARRSNRPSLYEVGRSRLDRFGQGIPESCDQETLVGEPAEVMRSVRLPMGFVVLAIAGVIGLILLSWWLGRGAGADEARRDFRSSGEARVLVDPLDAVVSEPAVQSPTELPPVVVPTPQTEPPVTLLQPESAGAVEITLPVPETAETSSTGDDRVPGLYYFIIETTTAAGAARTVGFCRENGLDARAIPWHNRGLVRVVVFPGLESARLSDPATQALAEQIQQVGLLWKQHDGHTNFHDKYLSLMKDPRS